MSKYSNKDIERALDLGYRAFNIASDCNDYVLDIEVPECLMKAFDEPIEEVYAYNLADIYEDILKDYERH